MEWNKILNWKIRILSISILVILGISNASAQSDNGIVKLSDDVEVKKLAKGIWLHTTYYDIEGYENYPANGLIIIDSEDAIMIDLPWTDKQAGLLFDWVAEKQGAVIKKVIPMHWHIDCAGGLGEAHRRKAESFALDKTVELLKANNEPAAQNWFTDKLSLICGKISVELAYLGPGHTKDNIVAWIPDRNILFGGCMVKSMNARNLGNTAEADVESWPDTLNKVKETYHEIKIVVPGHGQPGGVELIDHTIGLCGND